MFTNFNKINKQLDDANLLARKERNVNARGGQKQEAFQNYEIVFKCVEYLTIIINTFRKKQHLCIPHNCFPKDPFTASTKYLLLRIVGMPCHAGHCLFWCTTILRILLQKTS